MLKRELLRLKNRGIWSWAGWVECWRNEPSLQFWTLVNVASATLALWLPLAPSERALILALGVLILAAELMNTAVERVVDYISMDNHDMARKAKDLASAAVAVTAIAAGVAWLVVLIG